MPINSFLYPAPTNSNPYEVANSLRFDDGSSDNLTRTPSSTGDRQKFTFSTWVKRANLSSDTTIFASKSDSNNNSHLTFNSSDQLFLKMKIGGSTTNLTTNQLFRDVSAWYHIVLSVDTTQGTSSNRQRLYVNGTEITSFSASAYPSQNANTPYNWSSATNYIGTESTSQFLDGYLAETVLVDGQQLDATSFGEFDEDSSIWKPIDVSGLTFGTNGFYLDFENSGSLGADVSGNGNNFTVNNLTSIDQTTDTCTNNFAILNSLSSRSNNGTFSEGNTKFVGTMDGDWTVGTMAATAGKWYWEVKANEANYLMLGITTTDIISNNPTGSLSGDGFMGFRNTDKFYNFGTLVTSSYSFSDNDIFSFMLDLDAGDCEFYQNDTLKQTITLPTDKGDTWIPIIGDTYDVTDGNYNINFGNPSVAISSGNTDPNGYGNFEYATKTGYAWNTKNLAEYG